MTYHVGDLYKTVTRMVKGSPKYEWVKIRTVSPSPEEPEILWLENDQKIDLIPMRESDGRGK